MKAAKWSKPLAIENAKRSILPPTRIARTQNPRGPALCQPRISEAGFVIAWIGLNIGSRT
jgi:hypothetical protein